MKILRSSKDRSSEVSTAALPDIIFTLLFFFIVTGQVKENPKVHHDIPELEYVKKLKKDNNVTIIHVGYPFAEVKFGKPLIQINESIIRDQTHLYEVVMQTLQEVPRNKRPEHLFSVEADEVVPYGMINEIKETLRRAKVKRLHYKTKKKTI